MFELRAKKIWAVFHFSGVFDDAFNKVVLLTECYSYCLATIDLLVSGHDTYPDLIREEGMAHDVESYQKELNCCKEKDQLLPVYEDVVKLFADLDPTTKSQYVQQLKQEVEAVRSFPTFYCCCLWELSLLICVVSQYLLFGHGWLHFLTGAWWLQLNSQIWAIISNLSAFCFRLTLHFIESLYPPGSTLDVMIWQ